MPNMLTSLDFLREGAPWPPPTEADRLKLYRQNSELFEGCHEKVFKDWVKLLRQDIQASLEIILNWPKRLSTLFADLLLGEPPQVKAGDEGSREQETVNRLIERMACSTAYEVALDLAFGVGIKFVTRPGVIRPRRRCAGSRRGTDNVKEVLTMSWFTSTRKSRSCSQSEG